MVVLIGVANIKLYLSMDDNTIDDNNEIAIVSIGKETRGKIDEIIQNIDENTLINVTNKDGNSFYAQNRAK